MEKINEIVRTTMDAALYVLVVLRCGWSTFAARDKRRNPTPRNIATL